MGFERRQRWKCVQAKVPAEKVRASETRAAVARVPQLTTVHALLLVPRVILKAKPVAAGSGVP